MGSNAAIQRLETSRGQLLKLLETLSEAERDHLLVEGTWTVRETIAHICAWDTSLTTPLRIYVESGEFAAEIILDHDAWNARQVARRRGQSFAAILSEAEAVRSELLQLSEQLAGEDWQRMLPIPWGGEGTLGQMIDGLAWHEYEHTRSMLSVLHRD
jgi:uncharacterized damage-inducible protein DinB